MKCIRLVPVLLLIIIVGGAMAQQKETRQTEARKVGFFTGVSAAEGLDVFLKKGDQASVTVETNGNTSPSEIITEVAGTYLKIHVKSHNAHNVHAKIYVTYESLEKISISSGANVYAQGMIKARSFQIGCSSAGSAELDLDVEEVKVNVSSAGDVLLKGVAKSLSADVSSAGELNAYDLNAEVVNVSASSSGKARVSASKELNANASSAGDVRFKGNPDKSRTDSSSGGSVKKSY